jgi:type II secretory pathway component GspD/PulD (secretin)
MRKPCSLLSCFVAVVPWLAAQQPQQPVRPAAPRVFFAFENEPLHKVLAVVSKISGRRIVAAAELRETPITLRIKDVAWNDALAKLAESIGGKLVDDGERLQLLKRQPVGTRHVSFARVVPSAAQLRVARGMLTPTVGSLEYFENSRLFVIRDEQDVADRIAAYLESLDLGAQQLEKQLATVVESLKLARSDQGKLSGAEIQRLIAVTRQIEELLQQAR